MKSLYAKFVFFTITIMLSSFLLAFLGVNAFYQYSLKESNDEKNMNIAIDMAKYIENNQSLDLEKFFELEAQAGYKFYVIDEDQNDHFYGNEFRAKNLADESIETVMQGGLYHGMRDLPKSTFITGFFSDEVKNTVGVPFKYNDKQYALFLRPDIKLLFSEFHYILAGIFVGMALFSLLAMIIIAKKLITPITKLTEATKRVGQEDFPENLNITRKDEIGQLATSFQSMIHKLSENDRLRKEFISDVSHDFQTPLQNIKGYSDLLSDKELEDSKRIQYSGIIKDETERLSSLTRQLLLLTSLDQLSAPLEFKDFALDKQLSQVIRRNRWRLEEKEISLMLELESTTINGDEAFLENIWENLLSNAIKYTPNQGEIKVSMNVSDANKIQVHFEDNGIGIEKKHLPNIYERFYRADAARHSDIEGTGLGLSIVKQITDLHGGSITIDSIIKQGTSITVELPRL